MKFNELNTVIEDVLSRTFLEPTIIKNSYYDTGRKDEYPTWHFLYHNGAHETLIRISENISGVSCFTITDLDRFYKEFPGSNKMAYLIFSHDVVNCRYSLDAYQSYRFINAIKNAGIKLVEYSDKIKAKKR